MIWALLTSIFWSCSAICGQRAAMAFGSLRANLFRLILASILLGILTLALHRDSFSPATFGWLFLSGMVGFGFGDVALYLALARIGSRLTVLITFCLAPVVAGFGEWFWFREALSLRQWSAITLILLGVAAALRPGSPSRFRYGSVPFGLLMALGSATGQGFGAILTRFANEAALAQQFALPPLSQAFQRVIAGTLVSAIFFAISRRPGAPVPDRPPIDPSGWKWIVGTALAGPVIGVAFYQQALREANSAVVLAVVALTPIFAIPLAFWLERDRPTALGIAGAVLACAGVFDLASSRS